jgi:hypothetical protein
MSNNLYSHPVWRMNTEEKVPLYFVRYLILTTVRPHGRKLTHLQYTLPWLATVCDFPWKTTQQLTWVRPESPEASEQLHFCLLLHQNAELRIVQPMSGQRKTLQRPRSIYGHNGNVSVRFSTAWLSDAITCPRTFTGLGSFGTAFLWPMNVEGS